MTVRETVRTSVHCRRADWGARRPCLIQTLSRLHMLDHNPYDCASCTIPAREMTVTLEKHGCTQSDRSSATDVRHFTLHCAYVVRTRAGTRAKAKRAAVLLKTNLRLSCVAAGSVPRPASPAWGSRNGQRHIFGGRLPVTLVSTL